MGNKGVAMAVVFMLMAVDGVYADRIRPTQPGTRAVSHRARVYDDILMDTVFLTKNS